jgi:hypothetical protein
MQRRALLDFNDATIDRQGRVVVTYADGCGGSCVDAPPNTGSDLLTVARQVNGKRMFAEWDNLDVPAAPLGNAILDASNNAIVHLTWSAPDDHGSAITGYNLYRRTASGSFSLLVGLPSGQHAYDDTIDPAQSYFYKVTALTVRQGRSAASCFRAAPPRRAPASPRHPGGECEGDYEVRGQPVRSALRSMAGAFLTEGPPRLVVTMKVDNLQSPPINSAWRTVWTSPDGVIYWIDMDTFATGGAITFNYGTATTLPFGGLSFTQVGAADAGSFSSDGTIRVTISTSKVGSPQPGQTLATINAETELFIGGGGTGAIRIIDAAEGPGSYLVAGCGSQAPDALDDSAFTPFDTPVAIDVLANDTDPQNQPRFRGARSPRRPSTAAMAASATVPIRASAAPTHSPTRSAIRMDSPMSHPSSSASASAPRIRRSRASSPSARPRSRPVPSTSDGGLRRRIAPARPSATTSTAASIRGSSPR